MPQSRPEPADVLGVSLPVFDVGDDPLDIDSLDFDSLDFDSVDGDSLDVGLPRRGRRLVLLPPGRRLAPAVGLVEPTALERDAHRCEHLPHRHHLAGRGVRRLGKRGVVEGLLYFDRLAGVDEPVDVGGHRTRKSIGRDRGPRWSPADGWVWSGSCRFAAPSSRLPALGTRFLPASKAVPKELMPIGDTPALQLVIDEALGAGIDDIVVVVSSKGKPAIEAYFEPSPEVVDTLEAQRAQGARRPHPRHRRRLADHLSSTRTSPRASGTPVGAPRKQSVTSPSPCCCPTS